MLPWGPVIPRSRRSLCSFDKEGNTSTKANRSGQGWVGSGCDREQLLLICQNLPLPTLTCEVHTSPNRKLFVPEVTHVAERLLFIMGKEHLRESHGTLSENTSIGSRTCTFTTAMRPGFQIPRGVFWKTGISQRHAAARAMSLPLS